MAGSFEVFVDGQSNFRFRLKTPDGTVMAVSAAFSDKSAAVAGIAAVRECAGMGLITDLCPSSVRGSGVQESAHSSVAARARHEWHKRADGFHTRAKIIRRAAMAPRWTGAA
ncbi:uncharacterized protein YegP (UPF0339 family) [Arthrobacter ginsengisoli]|uniref:Uncharacterized protein YegP (UPF0339 family) n=1 Tax=Arthrobacter ginsengisoli TaxID=1356565 RepID=A0ABU1UCE2_9MICC|nr:DUF1508 domain-containing protein [Arthrobacter ginsengisoli]MDR7082780.1 uncharacterized protein YegP (UPF0339 family) [Arthrobacter ginsengisoli]